MSEWILQKYGEKLKTGFIWLRTGTSRGRGPMVMNLRVSPKAGNF